MRSSEALVARGESLLEVADTRAARTSFAAALAAEPGCVRARHGLGLCLAAERRDEEALAAFEDALADAPDDPGLLFSAGAMCQRLGLHDDAEARYCRLLALVPDHRFALLNLGVLRLMRRDFAGALAPLEQAVVLAPDDAGPRQSLALARAELEPGGSSRP
jgi:Flp pilus assembly protein TadD